MIISAHIKLYAKQSKLEEQWCDLFWNAHFNISLTSQPIDNQANQELIKLLSNYFNIPKTHIKIIRWHASRDKLIEVTRPTNIN